MAQPFCRRSPTVGIVPTANYRCDVPAEGRTGALPSVGGVDPPGIRDAAGIERDRQRPAGNSDGDGCCHHQNRDPPHCHQEKPKAKLTPQSLFTKNLERLRCYGLSEPGDPIRSSTEWVGRCTFLHRQVIFEVGGPLPHLVVLNRWRASRPSPIRPEPSSRREEGSGTASGA